MPHALLAIVLLVCWQAARASDAGVDMRTAETEFVARVHARFPGTESASIAPAFAGFHAVVKDGEVVFVRDDLSILITGNVIDLSTNASIAAAVRARHPRRVDLTKLNFEDAIHFGSGTKRLYVFSDPDCAYCRTLQAELNRLHDVQIYLFPFPLEGLHAGARAAAMSIWCQSDRAAAWDDYLVGHVAPPARTCAAPLERNLAVGRSLGIRGTPALIFADGSLIEGFASAERIEAQVAEGSK